MSFLMRKARGAAVTIGIGALTSYFLDPQLGRQRRQDVAGRVTALLGSVRDERSATQHSAYGDGDPTGGAVPSEASGAESFAADPPSAEPLPSDVLPTVPGPGEHPGAHHSTPEVDLGTLRSV
jgi:hypothetical protein